MTPGIQVHGEPGRRLLEDRKSTRLNSSHSQISYAVFCLKKKNKKDRSIQTLHSQHHPIYLDRPRLLLQTTSYMNAVGQASNIRKTPIHADARNARLLYA